MPVHIKRKNNENLYGLLRRFQDVFRKSRVAMLTKQNAYYEKPINKRKRKLEALRRQKVRERRDFLIRIGKITDEPAGNQKGRFKKKK